MLIYFNRDVIKKFEEERYSELELEYLERVVASHINSQHYMFSDRKSLNFLSNFEELSSTARKYFNKLEFQYTTIASYIKKIKTKISVVDKESYFEKDANDNSVKFNVSLDYFANPRTLDCTKLITENMDDCNFYKEVVKYYPNQFPSMLFNYSIESNDGNGNGITKSYLDKVENNNCVIAIVDSDRKYPNDDLGKTAKNLWEVFKANSDDYIAKYIELSLHEKENLVPYHFYKVLNIGNNTLEKLDILSKEKKFEDVFYHFDFKEGISTDNYINFFENVLDTEGIIEKEEVKDRDIFYGTKEEFFDYIVLRRDDKKKYPKKYILKPLGENLLKDFKLEKMREFIEKKLSHFEKIKTIPRSEKDFYTYMRDIVLNPINYLLPKQKECLRGICQILIEWGLCKPRNATN